MVTDESSPTPAIRLTGLRKSYGDVTALDGVSLTINPGEFFTMLGPSGSGKDHAVAGHRRLRAPGCRHGRATR